MDEFDPDAYLSETGDVGFDPDAYLADDGSPDAATPESTRSTGGAALPALQGLTLGFGDEGMAAVMAAIATGLPQSMGGASDELSYDENYQGLLEGMREDTKQYKEDNPVKSALAEIGGGIATGGAGFAKAGIKEGAKLGERVARGGGVGVVEAALYGAGSSEEGGRVEGAIEAAPYGFAGGAAGGEIIEQGSKYFKNRTALKDKLIEKIESGEPSKSIAKLELIENPDGSKSIQKNRQAQEAIKQGFDSGVISSISKSGGFDKSQMNKMLNLKSRGIENPEFAQRYRPTDVVGESLKVRFDKVKSANKAAGKAVDKEAQKLKKDFVEYSPVITQFEEDLANIGVTLDNNLNLNFKGSDIEDLSINEKVLDNVVNRMKSGKVLSAYDLHRMKKYVDSNVTYGKADGLDPKVSSLLKGLRRGLNESIGESFPAYKKANATYKESLDGMDNLQKAAGKSIDFDSKSGPNSLGTALRGLMSNIKSRGALSDSVDEIDALATKYGGVYEDNIHKLMLFADELDTVFKPSARTSLAGEQGKAFRQGADAVRRGPYDLALDQASQLVEKARGISEEGAIQSMKDLLNK